MRYGLICRFYTRLLQPAAQVVKFLRAGTNFRHAGTIFPDAGTNFPAAHLSLPVCWQARQWQARERARYKSAAPRIYL